MICKSLLFNLKCVRIHFDKKEGFSMNLKEEILKEKSLHPEWDLFTLIRWIYLKTCQIFTYDWEYLYADEKRRKSIYDTRLDLSNIEMTDIICSTWAHLFHDALALLNIDSKIITTTSLHCLVQFTLDNLVIHADATQGYDFSRVKIGCSTNGLLSEHSNFSDRLNEADIIIGYNKNVYTDAAIKQIKNDFITDGYIKNQSNDEMIDYEQILFKLKLIQDLINNTQKIKKFYDTDFYLSYLGRYFFTIKEKYELLISPFWKFTNMSDIIDVIILCNIKEPQYFLLKKINDKYYLVNTTFDEINGYLEKYHGNLKERIRSYNR